MTYKQFMELADTCPWKTDSAVGGKNVCGAQFTPAGYHGTPCMFTKCAVAHFMSKINKAFTRGDERG